MKEHILIVEDEATLYERLRRALVKHHFEVDTYTKSYDEALERISKKRPDVVLLDINLQGDKTGIDLGHVLYKTYNIPFIYVTDLDDTMTFAQGLQSNHEQFIVKTKPRLNIDDVIRGIHTVLHKVKNNLYPDQKDNIIGLVNYLDELNQYGVNEVTRVPIPYNIIAYFTTDFFINENNEKEVLKPNYLWFKTLNKEYYFLKSSLKDLLKHLPPSFVRINDSYIVNISPEVLQGRINGSRLSILGNELSITRTYAKDFEKRMGSLYHS